MMIKKNSISDKFVCNFPKNSPELAYLKHSVEMHPLRKDS